jgi:stress-induced morphogen
MWDTLQQHHAVSELLNDTLWQQHDALRIVVSFAEF